MEETSICYPKKQVSGIFSRQVVRVRNKNIRKGGKKKPSLVLDGCTSHLGKDTKESRETREAASSRSWSLGPALPKDSETHSPRKNYNSQKSRAQKGEEPTACGRGLQGELWTSPARNSSRSGGSGGYGSTGRERGAGDGAGSGIYGLLETASLTHSPRPRIS